MEDVRMNKFSNVQSTSTFSEPLKRCLNNTSVNNVLVHSSNMLSIKSIPVVQHEACSQLNGTLCLNHDLVNGDSSRGFHYETDECETDCSCNKLKNNNDSLKDSSQCNCTENIAENLHNELVQCLSLRSPNECSVSDACENIVKTESNPVSSYVSSESLKDIPAIRYVSYESEVQMADIMRLIQKDLSEPYSIYTYRYFIHNWPHLCFLAFHEQKSVGAIVCKLDMHRKVVRRGYIAMLAVDEKYRKLKIGSNLVLKAIRSMVADGADEVVLETEITNRPALKLYENLGFVRDKRLFRYYLNGVDALRLKLWLR